MDYFSVVVLIIVTFIFVSDKTVKSIDIIKEQNKELNIMKKIQDIKQEFEIIQVSSKHLNYKYILDRASKSYMKYMCFINNKIKIEDSILNTLIANYIYYGEKYCGFNLLYEYKSKDNKFSFRKLYLDIINYLNIFNKKDFSTYGIIIIKRAECSLNEKTLKKNIITFTSNKYVNIQLNDDEIKTKELRNIYIGKIKEANIDIIIKIFLLIISGSIITTNLIYSILNVNNNISGLITSAVIYFCYSYAIRYIYKPLGKQRVIATYLFPVYFLSYVFVGIYAVVGKVIKKVQAS